MRITRPELRRNHPQLRGLRVFLPWGMGGSDRTGLFAAVKSPAELGAGFFDGIALGGVLAPEWYNDNRFGAVPDFVNDTNNRALTAVNGDFHPVNVSPLTVTGWVWPHVQEDNAVVIGRWTSFQSGWVLRLRKDTAKMGMRFEVQYATTSLITYVADTGLIPINQWSHIACAWDGSSVAADVAFYVNGNLVTASRFNQNAVGLRKDDSPRPLLIGASNTANPASGKFKGRMGPIKVYARVFTQQEVQDDFLNPSSLIIPVAEKRRRRYQYVPAAGSSQIVDFDRVIRHNVREFVSASRSTEWNVETTATQVFAERAVSWNVLSTVVSVWPIGPINKRQIGFYEVNVVTPTLIELTLIHTNANVEQRPSRWNFVGPDWVSYNTPPAPATFIVRQQIV